MNTIIILLWSVLGLMVLGYSFYYGFWLGRKSMKAKIRKAVEENIKPFGKSLYRDCKLADQLVERIKRTDFGTETNDIQKIMYSMIVDEMHKIEENLDEEFERAKKTVERRR